MKKILFLFSLTCFMASCNSDYVKQVSDSEKSIDNNSVTNSDTVYKTNQSPFSENGENDFTYRPSENIPARFSQEERRKRFENLKESFTLKGDTFFINPLKDTTIKSSKGTLIFIEAYCLQDKKGNTITKPVTYVLKEYKSYADILKFGLTTTSDGALLETAGMLSLEAYSGNQELEIRSGYKILISPGEKIDEEYELFSSEYFSNGEINWKIDSTAKSEPLIITPINGRYSKQPWVQEYFISQYRIAQEDLREIKGKVWECTMNTYGGEIIGSGGNSGENNDIEKAILKFNKVAPLFYEAFLKEGKLKSVERNTDFSFKVLTRTELLMIADYENAMNAFGNFRNGAIVIQQSTSPGIIALSRLGMIVNIDKYIRYEEVDLGPRITLAITQKEIPNPIRTVVVLEDIRSVVPCEETSNGIVAKGIPAKSYGKVIVTGIENNKYYLGVSDLTPGSTIISKLETISEFESSVEYSKALEEIANISESKNLNARKAKKVKS